MSRCCNLGCYAACDALGISSETTCCCLEQLCCVKLGTAPILCGRSEKECCRIGLGCCGVGLVRPTTCFKAEGQICCIVQSCAFPPDEEIPATCAFLGLALCPYCGCCVRLNKLKEHQKKSDSGGPPSPELQEENQLPSTGRPLTMDRVASSF